VFSVTTKTTNKEDAIMKIKVEVEIDWINEEGNLDAEIQEQIISGVKSAISKDCLKLVEHKTSMAIDDGMKKAIETMQEKVSDFFEQWLNKETILTDKYGDIVKKGSLNEIIKSQFNDCMNERVDKDGKITSYNGISRIEFFSGKKVKEVVDDSLKSYAKNIDETIKKQIELGIKERVSNKFAEMVIGYAKHDFEDAKAITHNKG
jgi:hypothetical protein